MTIRDKSWRILRQVSTNAKKLQVEVATAPIAESCPAAQKDYYKNLGAKASQLNEKPEQWDQAKPFSSIPGPKPLPLIGNIHRFFPGGEFYNQPMLDMHSGLRSKYGEIVALTGLPGKRDMIILYNPTETEKVNTFKQRLTKDQRLIAVFRNEGPFPIRFGLPSFVYYRTHVRQDVFQGVGGVLSVQGEEWFNFRSIVNKILMQPRTAQLYVSSMDEVANGLIDNIRFFAKQNEDHEMPEDFQNELYKWTMESIGVIAYNRRLGCLSREGSEEGQNMISSSIKMFEYMYKLDVLPSLWPFFPTKTWRNYVKILDYLTYTNQKYIEKCLEEVKNRKIALPEHEQSVLERLMNHDKKVAVAMATDLTIAGVDTTGRTMASALYYLARNPDKQENLRQELRQYLPHKDSPVTKDIILQAPYLKAVIKEVTRLAPVAIGNLRTSIKDMVIGGYQIPKGSDLISINLLLSHDEAYFKDAKKFIPERWLRDVDDEYSAKNVHPFVSLPFGFGPRSCIGKRLANLELEVGLSKVIRNFKISWPHKDAEFGITLLYGIKDPLKFRVEEVQD